ncbi:hypothetical protein VZT92_016359 [Zoarces viviparus]|uniref:Uncharacterized protein n=1 Tax=Zoarces viviparus TaxID=48416 RepID=A0AAW1ESU8_ZOAVI
MCLSLLCCCSHSPHPSQKCTWGDGEDGASAKLTICRHLEINDRPKPSGSPSHSAASAGAVTGPPNLPFPLKSMCETPASHAGVCLGERDLEWIWSLKHSLLLRGAGRWNSVVKPAVSPLITAANRESWKTHRFEVDPTGKQLKLHFI